MIIFKLAYCLKREYFLGHTGQNRRVCMTGECAVARRHTWKRPSLRLISTVVP